MIIEYLIIFTLVLALISVKWKRIAYALLSLDSLFFIWFGINQFSLLNYLGVFSIVGGFVWFFSSLFSIFYDHEKWLAPSFITSILGMQIALISSTYLQFLAGYEIMTIPAYFAIGVNRLMKSPAFTFMAFGEFSTVLVLVGFLDAYLQTGSLYFQHVFTYLPLVLVSFGFMIKMGIFPFLVTEWLPIAHGSAPSNLSAILSASMTLIAVYGLTRMAILSPSDIFLGLLLMAIGAFSTLFGSLYSYVNEHVKGLLAFSTVENDGAILASIGLYISYPNHVLSLFALATVTLFVSAHSLAKTGLFLSTGLIQGESISSSNTLKDTFSVVGVVLLTSSMSGLLPTLGGVATWALLESLFMDAFVLHSVLSIIPILVGTIIAMGEGFATAAMIKYVSFTQIFKTSYGKDIRKSAIVLTVGVLVLIAGSLSIFLFPSFISGTNLGVPPGFLLSSRFSSSAFGGIAPFFILFLIPFFSLLLILVFGKPKTRTAEVWNNGREIKDKYTSFAYSNNIRLMLRKLLRTKVLINGVEIAEDIFWIAMLKISRSYIKFSKLIATAYMNSDLRIYMVYMIIAFIVVVLLVVVI
ncbi:proton-conducting transporter membrane subunit [Candidatus Acidianus copahuensis]|uniref:proton-conducting transporter transmembrane domain-containing protein n=1 Tax=Candidatus Acidianus copahuensis TaxID=1160895 RepID=UPI00064F2B06|nr:proton-conducting transporter membrane subunit [Candidatus Acidianus copahuensis]